MTEGEKFEHKKFSWVGNVFIHHISIKVENDVNFLILQKNKPLPTNGLKINRSLHTKKKAKERETVMTVLKYPVPVVTGITN